MQVGRFKRWVGGISVLGTMLLAATAASLASLAPVAAQQECFWILQDWHKHINNWPDPWRHVGQPDWEDPPWVEDEKWLVIGEEWHYTDEANTTHQEHPEEGICGPADS